MTCYEFQSRLSGFLDGELSRWTRWKVRNHLRTCPECAGVLEDLEAVDSLLLAAAEASPAPEYVTGAVMRRLPAMPPAARPRVAAWAAAAGMAAVQLLCLAGAYWWGFAQGSGTARTRPAGVLPLPSVPGGGASPSAAGGAGRGAGLWSSPREEFAPAGLATPAVLATPAARGETRKPERPLTRPGPAVRPGPLAPAFQGAP